MTALRGLYQIHAWLYDGIEDSPVNVRRPERMPAISRLSAEKVALLSLGYACSLSSWACRLLPAR